MTPEAQRIAIAEACGWKYDSHYVNDKHWHKGQELAREWHELPDYLSDLNAMHEAEKTLTPEQAMQFNAELQKVMGLYGGRASTAVETYEWHATAAQRAKAFLRTLNLWTPEPACPQDTENTQVNSVSNPKPNEPITIQDVLSDIKRRYAPHLPK